MHVVRMKKILITGASGLLGDDLVRTLSPNYNLLCTSKSKLSQSLKILDITNKRDVTKLIDDFKPSVIINCAAYTNVDKAENNRKDARETNVIGLYNLVKAASRKIKSYIYLLIIFLMD